MASFEKAPALRASSPLVTSIDPAPQRQLADGIGEQAVGNRIAVVDGQFRPFGVGRQENLERGLMGDLGIESAGSAENQHGFMAGLGLEQGGDFFRRFGEIGGDGDMGGSSQDRSHEGDGQRGNCNSKLSDEVHHFLQATGDFCGGLRMGSQPYM